MPREITLTDLYAKLSKIERRLSRVESMVHRLSHNNANIPLQNPNFKQQVLLATEKSTVEEKVEPQKKDDKKPEIDLTNWKFLLGLE